MPFEAEILAFDEDDMTSTKAESYSQISIYPNPAVSGESHLTISGYDQFNEPLETQIKIITMTGEVLFAERIVCGGSCREYFINISEQLVPGVYVVQMQTDGERSSQRLLVK